MNFLENNSVKTNAFLNFIRTLLTLVFSLITFPYSSRILLPDGIGKTVFANSVVSWFSMIAMLGINAYGIREAAKIRNDCQNLSKFVKEIFLINSISTIVSYALFFFIIFNNPAFSKYSGLLIIYSVTILFTTIGIDWLYIALEDFFYITVRSFVFQILGVIFLFTFVKTQNDLFKYALINVFSSVGSNICNFIHARKILFTKTSEKLEIKRHLKPLFILFSLALTSSIYTLLDTTMLGIIGSPSDVGIYAAATKINRIVLTLVVSVCTVLLPRLSFFYGNNEKEKFLDLFYRLVEIVLMFGFPCAIGLCVLGRPMIVFFSGAEFLASIPVMRIMNPIIVIVSLSNCIGVQLFMPLRKEKLTLFSDTAGAVVNFTLNFFLIKNLGATGAAIGSVLAETTVLIIQLFFARKIVKLNFFVRKILFYFLLSSIMGALVIFVSNFFQNLVLKISISVLSGIAVYSALLFLTKRKFILSFFNQKK